jgi:cell division protein FtsQ
MSVHVSLTPRGRTSTWHVPRRRGAQWLAWAALAVGGAVVVIGGVAWLRQKDALPVQQVRVVGVGVDANSARTAEIIAYADIAPGTSLLALNPQEVAERVAEHPFVSSVKVERTLGGDVVLDIQQRTPVAVLRAEDGLYLVDEHAFVMKRVMAGDATGLPVVSLAPAIESSADAAREAVLPSALTVLRTYARLQAPLGAASEVVERSGVGFTLVVGGGLELHVGRSDFEAKLQRAQQVAVRLAEGGREAASMYLDDERRPERVAVSLRATAEPKAGG